MNREEVAKDRRLYAVEGISKRYGSVVALESVDFSVDAGEVVGLVGDNGAGKSTLVSILSGILTADSGEIFLNGTSGLGFHRMKRSKLASRPSIKIRASPPI